MIKIKVTYQETVTKTATVEVDEAEFEAYVTEGCEPQPVTEEDRHEYARYFLEDIRTPWDASMPAPEGLVSRTIQSTEITR